MPLYLTSDDLLFNLEATSSSDARKKWKRSIKEHWNNQCAYCGNVENLTLDHITPQSKGGTNRLTNVICACDKCNKSKGHQMWSNWYLQQNFFSTERLSKIIEWQNQILDAEFKVYCPRKI